MKSVCSLRETGVVNFSNDHEKNLIYLLPSFGKYKKKRHEHNAFNVENRSDEKINLKLVEIRWA
jgi:hypothetical protein